MAMILLVEDELDLSRLIRTELEAAGHRVEQAFDGLAAVRRVDQEQFDLVILDWMLPGLDGLAVCRRLRERYLVPIIMLTARTQLVDRVLGLEVGADDYLGKPFSMHELRVRVAAMLRRVAYERQAGGAAQRQPPAPPPAAGLAPTPPLTCGRLAIQPDERRVSVDGRPVELTRREYDLLLLLASHPNRTFGRTFLLERLWGEDYDGLDRVVDTQITRLRKKLGAFGNQIETVWGIGYRIRV